MYFPRGLWKPSPSKGVGLLESSGFLENLSVGSICWVPGDSCQGLPILQAPCLLPLHPVAMGTSILQLTEQLARCLFFSFYLGLIFAFIFWASSLLSPGAQSSGQSYLFGMM